MVLPDSGLCGDDDDDDEEEEEEAGDAGDTGSVMSLLLLHDDASEQVSDATPLYPKDIYKKKIFINQMNQFNI